MSLSRSLSLWLTISIATISPWIILFALPFFDLGVFRQVETVSVALHTISSAAAIALILVMATAPGVANSVISRTAIPIFAIGVLGLLFAALTPDPLMSIHGSLELGVGSLWYMELAILIAVSSIAWAVAKDRARVLLALSPAVAICGAATLHLTGWKLGDNPIVVYEYEEWIGLASMLSVVPLFSLNKKWATITAFALVVFGLAISGNRTAVLSFVVFIAIAATLWKFRVKSIMIGILASLAALSIAAAMVVSVPLMEKITLTQIPTTAPVVSEKAIDQVSVHNQIYGTIWQRGINIAYMLVDIKNNPDFLWHGAGFGSFERAIAEQGHWAAGRTFEEATETASLTYWDGRLKARIHSHNFVIENLAAVGLLGLGLWMLFIYTIGRNIDRERILAGSMLLSVVVLGCSFWFLPNSMAPYLALAIGSSISTTAYVFRDFLVSNRERFGSIIMLPSAAIFAVMAMIQYSSIQVERSERGFNPLPSVVCDGFDALTIPSLQVNRSLYKILTTKLENQTKDMLPIFIGMHSKNIQNFSCILRKAADEGDTLALRDSLLIRARIISMFSANDPLVSNLLSVDIMMWEEDLKKMLKFSKDNQYLIMPYLAWLAGSKDAEKESSFINYLIDNLDKNEPLHLFAQYRSAILSADGEKADFYGNAALRAGLANMVPMSFEYAKGLGYVNVK